MLGFRGASRYAHPAYADGFALECAALKRVRDEMGLTNLRVMVPFCRRVDEGRQVIEAMAEHGLKRGENGLEIYVMCEIPNNVIHDRRLRRAVRRLLDRLQRPDAADAWGSTAIPRSSPSISTSAIPACSRCSASPSPARSATTAMSASAARRRPTIPRSRSSSPGSGSTRSASMRRASCARCRSCTRPSSAAPPRSPPSSRRRGSPWPIVTLTMNPALDIATSTDRVVPTHKLRCAAPRYDPGGGGINVARAVHALGGDAVAIFPAGGAAGEMIRHLLDEEDVAYDAVAITGFTRESLAVEERATGNQFRFILPGPEI